MICDKVTALRRHLDPPRRRSARLLPFALAVALVPGGARADAQVPDRGLFGIAPAKLLLQTRPPRAIRPLQLTNTTRLTYDVRIFPAPLRQTADGGLAYDASPAGRRLGARTLEVGGPRLTMGPDSRRTLPLRWLATFPGQRVAPMGVVVQGIPRGVATGTVSARYRLVGTYLLRLPGGRHGGGFGALSAEQGPRRSLRFTAVVHNTGEVYEQPQRGHVSVTDATGRLVTRAGFAGKVILPGARVPFVVTTRKVLPAGVYTARASMRLAGRVRQISRRFRLVGPNELPTTRLAVVGLRAEGERGKAAHATVRVRNTGTRTVVATVRAALAPAAAPTTPSDRASARRRLAPGSEASVEVALGRLDAGDVVVTATVLAGRKGFDSAGVTLTPRPDRSTWARIKRFWSEHGTVLLLGVVLLFALALAESTRRRRRLRVALLKARRERENPEIGARRDPQDPPLA